MLGKSFLSLLIYTFFSFCLPSIFSGSSFLLCMTAIFPRLQSKIDQCLEFRSSSSSSSTPKRRNGEVKILREIFVISTELIEATESICQELKPARKKMKESVLSKIPQTMLRLKRFGDYLEEQADVYHIATVAEEEEEGDDSEREEEEEEETILVKKRKQGTRRKSESLSTLAKKARERESQDDEQVQSEEGEEGEGGDEEGDGDEGDAEDEEQYEEEEVYDEDEREFRDYGHHPAHKTLNSDPYYDGFGAHFYNTNAEDKEDDSLVFKTTIVDFSSTKLGNR
jgi:hypothetical protein